jgi:hypothetical protein
VQSLLVVDLLYELAYVLLGFLKAAVVFEVDFPIFRFLKKLSGLAFSRRGCPRRPC